MSVARTAAGTAAATLLALAANLGRFAVAAPGKHQECPPGRRTPRYPTLMPSSHVREIRARERRHARPGDVLQRRPERLTVGRGHQHRRPDPRPRRSAMWASMSLSTSLSSSIFGLAKTAKPTLRSASTQGRTTSALPGAMLVNTVASGSSDDRPADPADSSAVRASSQRPSASKRGRCAAVGRPPRIEPSPMSRLGASHTSSTRCGAGSTTSVPASGTAGNRSLVCVFGHAHGRLSQMQFGYRAARVVGLRLVLGGRALHRDADRCLSSPGSTRRSRGSASPASAICSA